MENNYENKSSYTPTISIKKIEGTQSKTYTDYNSNIDTLDKLAIVTNRSFNDVLKEIVKDFLDNGRIYDEDNDKYIPIREIEKVFGEKISNEMEKRKKKDNE